MSGDLNLERRAADQVLLAIEHGDLDGDSATGNDLRCGLLRRQRHGIAERYALALRGARRAFGDMDCELETIVVGRDGRILARGGGAHEGSPWR